MLIIASLGLQVSVFVARISMWGSWAEEVREAGTIYSRDGSFSTAYSDYMDTNWIRIAVISAYAVLAITMSILAVSQQRRETLRASQMAQRQTLHR